MARSVTLAAPAKLNLHLGIHPGRDDRGYHRADSIMVAVALADRVAVTEFDRRSSEDAARRVAPGSTPGAASGAASGPSSRVCLAMSEDVGVATRDNTAWIAAMRMCREFGVSRDYQIEIEKNIPPQSGLGGSSSDAASVILALCSLWEVGASDERVVSVARSVGADVAFFLDPRPSYLVGAGDVLVESYPELGDVPILLVRPRAGVPTADAFGAFDERPASPRDARAMRDALSRGDLEAVCDGLYNNLGPAALRIVPEDAVVCEWLGRQEGVRGLCVTGSGSCVFAVCDTHERASDLAGHALDTQGWWSCATMTVGSGAQFC